MSQSDIDIQKNLEDPLFAAIIAPFSHTRPSNDAAIWHRRDMFCTDLSAVVWFVLKYQNNMGVSKNRGTPKTSILIGFPIMFTIHFGVNTPIFGNTQKTKPSIQMEDGAIIWTITNPTKSQSSDQFLRRGTGGLDTCQDR